MLAAVFRSLDETFRSLFNVGSAVAGNQAALGSRRYSAGPPDASALTLVLHDIL